MPNQGTTEIGAHKKWERWVARSTNQIEGRDWWLKSSKAGIIEGSWWVERRKGKFWEGLANS